MSKIRTGILGGTFNPIHSGHLRMAKEAMRRCSLDRVLFLPAVTPPHKEIAGDIPFEDRCQMVAAAIADDPAFHLSRMESERQGKSFTVDTLHQFNQRYPDEAPYFIMGADSFVELHLWYRFAEIFGLSNLIVLGRPGHSTESPIDLLPVATRPEFCYASGSDVLVHRSGFETVIIGDFSQNISSTEIRNLVGAQAPVAEYLPAAVASYIEAHRLYRHE